MTRTRKRTTKTIKPQYYQLERGLTKKEAFLAAAKIAKRDWRGMKYDPKTGKAVLI